MSTFYFQLRWAFLIEIFRCQFVQMEGSALSMVELKTKWLKYIDGNFLKVFSRTTGQISILFDPKHPRVYGSLSSLLINIIIPFHKYVYWLEMFLRRAMWFFLFLSIYTHLTSAIVIHPVFKDLTTQIFLPVICLAFIVPLEKFSLLSRHYHYRSVLMAIEQWGFFILPHILWHRASVIMSICENPWHSHLLPSV